jgi:ParB/RepB/Spo0J family partition protein
MMTWHKKKKIEPPAEAVADVTETSPEEVVAVAETVAEEIIDAGEYSGLTVTIVPLNEIIPDPDTQPRSPFNAEEANEDFDDLVRSIIEHGILQPILLRKDGNRNLIVAGERRFHASKVAGRSSIPVIYTDGDPATIALIENLHRVGLTTIEEAEALAKISEAKNCDDKLLAEMIGKSQSTISVLLKIAALPEVFRNKYRAAKNTSQRKLIAIARIKDIDDQQKAMEKFVKDEQKSIKVPKEEVQELEMSSETAEINANKLAMIHNKKQQEQPFRMILKIGTDLTVRIKSMKREVLPKLNPDLNKSVHEMLSNLSEILQTKTGKSSQNIEEAGEV